MLRAVRRRLRIFRILARPLRGRAGELAVSRIFKSGTFPGKVNLSIHGPGQTAQMISYAIGDSAPTLFASAGPWDRRAEGP